MEVTVFSIETITPSNPTLSDDPFKTFKLSCLEKLSPLVYTPLIFFYSMNNVGSSNLLIEQAITTLKRSLSETLNRFLFLEGEISDNASIKLTYDDVIFIQANIGCRMSNILRQPHNEIVLMELLRHSTLCTNPEQKDKYVQISIQVNIFECGGVAISLCLLHELMDATTLSSFLRSWVCININSFKSFPNIVCSDFGPLSSLFDPRQRALSSNFERRSCFERIELKENAIPKLIEEVESNNVLNPTCVEVLTGFLWKCALDVALARPGSSQSPSILTHAVNLHNKMPYSSPKFSVGNFWWVVVAQYFVSQTYMELSDLVKLLRQSFEKINEDYIQGLVGNNNEDQNEAIANKLHERDHLLSKTPKLYLCTSWQDMDFNEVGFGWGNAIWVGTTRDSSTMTENIAILLRAVSNDDIEVWIVLDEEEKQLLARNLEFCNFALLKPNIP